MTTPNVDPAIVAALAIQGMDDREYLTVEADGTHVVDAGDRNLWICTESDDSGTGAVYYSARESDPRAVGSSGVLWQPEGEGPWALVEAIADHVEEVTGRRLGVMSVAERRAERER